MDEPILLTESETDVQSDDKIVCASSVLTAPKSSDPTGAFRIILCLLICLSAIVCKIFYPAGSEYLQNWIIGTGDERIQVAVSSFDAALQDGQPVGDAISVFYQQIFHETES